MLILAVLAERFAVIAEHRDDGPVETPITYEVIEELPETLGEAIDIAAHSELVLRVLGEHTFNRFIEIKRAEWAEYRVQVTPWEIDRFLPVL